VTVLIQSSSGTTVMTVSFVHAGLMTLKQAVGVIMGANIGTTVTAQLIAFKIKDFALPIVGIGMILAVFGRTKHQRYAGNGMVGSACSFWACRTWRRPCPFSGQEGFFPRLQPPPPFWSPRGNASHDGCPIQFGHGGTDHSP
jgi:phosphate:Na+ symporter